MGGAVRQDESLSLARSGLCWAVLTGTYGTLIRPQWVMDWSAFVCAVGIFGITETILTSGMPPLNPVSSYLECIIIYFESYFWKSHPPVFSLIIIIIITACSFLFVLI